VSDTDLHARDDLEPLVTHERRERLLKEIACGAEEPGFGDDRRRMKCLCHEGTAPTGAVAHEAFLAPCLGLERGSQVCLESGQCRLVDKVLEHDRAVGVEDGAHVGDG
jgi:hypothetical protein